MSSGFLRRLGSMFGRGDSGRSGHYTPSVIAPRPPKETRTVSSGRTAGAAVPRPTAQAAGGAKRTKPSKARGFLGRFWAYPVVVVGCALFGMGIYYGYIYVVKAQWLAVTEVLVEGTSRVTPEEVVAAAQIEVGSSVLDISCPELENRIVTNLGWVRRVDVQIEAPSSVRIRLEERTPAAILADTYSCLVDSDGVVFKIMSPAEYSKDLVVLSGMNYYELTGKEYAALAQERIREALALAGDYASRGLSEFVVLREVQFDEALGYTLVGDGGQQIVFGVGRHREKMLWLASVVSYLAERGASFEAIHMDNERRPEQVVVSGTGLRGDPLTLDMSNRVSRSARRQTLAEAERSWNGKGTR